MHLNKQYVLRRYVLYCTFVASGTHSCLRWSYITLIYSAMLWGLEYWGNHWLYVVRRIKLSFKIGVLWISSKNKTKQTLLALAIALALALLGSQVFAQGKRVHWSTKLNNFDSLWPPEGKCDCNVYLCRCTGSLWSESRGQDPECLIWVN